MGQVEEITTVSNDAPTRVTKTTREVTPSVTPEHPQKVYQKKKAIFRSYQIVWYVLVVIELLLGFRATLEALAANPNSGFTSFIYAISAPLAVPFQGILNTTITPSGSVFEWSIIIAAVVYLLIAVGIVQLIQFVKPVTQTEVEAGVDNT